MNILSIDTSTKKANVCLEYNEKILNKSIDNEITHSEKLLPLIDEVLKSSNCSLNEINYLACSAGPGSFTGIRIGIATIKAFAKTLNIPIFNVSSLDILAYSKPTSDYIVSIMDAKNTRIYYCVYKVNYKNDIPYLYKVSDYANHTIDVALEEISNVLLNRSLDKQVSINIVGDCIDIYSNLFIEHLNSISDNISTYTESLDASVLTSMLKNYMNIGIDNQHMQDYLTLDAIYVRPSQAERAKNNEL